jgi:hypothetical protein
MAQIILDSNNNLIQGDFDNATLNNRTKLQTTTTNATTNVYVVPNGSSTSAGVSVANNSNLTNASKIVMATNGTTDTQIISGVNGSGTYLPLSFYTNNALAMQIGTNGQVTVAATANPTFSAYCSSTQSISAATNTKIQYQTEEWDTNNNFDNTTNYRFTPTVAGYYQISGSINFQSAPTSISLLSIYKNGSEFKRCFQTNASIYGINGSAVVYCNGSTDYIELYCYQSGGGAINTSTGNALTYFQAAMIRSA